MKLIALIVDFVTRLQSARPVGRAGDRGVIAKSTSAFSENMSWLHDRAGVVIDKKAESGMAALSTWERLVYCLWVADYMMGNAGDFENAVALYRDFQTDAERLARQLSLTATCEAFSLSRRRLQREYYQRFEAICDEIRKAEPLS